MYVTPRVRDLIVYLTEFYLIYIPIKYMSEYEIVFSLVLTDQNENYQLLQL